MRSGVSAFRQLGGIPDKQEGFSVMEGFPDYGWSEHAREGGMEAEQFDRRIKASNGAQ